MQYRAYGNVVRTIANEIEAPLRFQGQYFDAESGLHYNRHRYYQPETGRFLTPDPIKLAGGLNNYQYVPNPLNWVDPLGLASIPGNCPNANKFKRVDKHYQTRSQAFHQAKVDAKIPRNQQPFDVRKVDLTDKNGKIIFDSEGNTIPTREYDYINTNQDRITIQEHSLGHSDFPGDSSEMPHFNVRDFDIVEPDGRRTTTPQSLKLVAKHYTFKREKK